MKTNITILLFSLLPLCLFSQMNSSIDFIAGIDYSNRSLKINSESLTFADVISSRNSRETGKLNWRVGFNYNKRLSSKIFLKSGIRLTSVGYQDEKMTGLRWPSEIGPDGYMPDPSLPHEIQLVYDYWFVEVPLVGRYEFSDSKFSPFIEAGISPSYYLTTRTKLITDLETKTSSERGGLNNSYSNWHLVGVLSLGSNYTINDKWQLFGQAAYRYHFTKLIDAPIIENLFNYGIEFGIRRKLN